MESTQKGVSGATTLETVDVNIRGLYEEDLNHDCAISVSRWAHPEELTAQRSCIPGQRANWHVIATFLAAPYSVQVYNTHVSL